MAAILANDNLKCIFSNENYRIPIPNFTEICSQDSNWQKASIVSGNGLLHELILIHFTDTYRKTSNISRTLIGSKIVDNSDVVGASPVGAAPTTSSFST